MVNQSSFHAARRQSITIVHFSNWIPACPWASVCPQLTVTLSPGKQLLLYTDGISESYDESGVELGIERLLSIARALPTETPVAAGKALLGAVARFRGKAPSADDETVVALQRRTGRV